MRVKKIDSVYYTKKIGNWKQEPSFNSFYFDSREVKQNSLFVAHKGETVNANKFIKDAYVKGASFIIAENEEFIPEKIDIPVLITDDVIRTMQDIVRLIRHDNREKKIIGITGTTGKTSTKDIMYSVLSEKFKTGKTEGNMNTEWGVPYTFLNNIDKDILVIEMGMDHPGDIKKLTEALQPDISIITNISPVHLKYMGSMDKIYRGKTDVFRYSDNSFLKLIKGDDDYSKRAKKEFANVKTYGKNENNDYSFELIDSKKNIKFEFFGENYELNLWGEFNIYNSLPAIIVAKELGIDYTQIKKGLKKVNISSNRINIIEKKGKIIINDTYNSSPSALKAVVDEMKKKYENKKKMLVLGDMLELGRYSEKYHRETVEYIEKNLHNKKCLFLGEEFNKLRNEYESQNFYFSREKLFNDLKKLLDEYDVFLFKASRGLKLEIVVNKVLGSI